MFLSHSIYYQHGSVSVSTIISVNYKNITNSKICHNIEANHSMLQSLSQTFYTVNENQLIYWCNTIKCIFYVFLNRDF